MASAPRPDRLPYVEAVSAKGRVYLYYRRDGQRLPLAGPEGSKAFRVEYDAVHGRFSRPEMPWDKHTVGHAITEYLSSSDYVTMKSASKRVYRAVLDDMRDRVGAVAILDIDIRWIERLRDRLADRPNHWNSIRSRMTSVFDMHHRRYPTLLPFNPWKDVKRVTPPRSTQNRRWPDEVLEAILREATPEFRALLITLLLTGQRIGDVTKFTLQQYDPVTRTLGYADIYDQEKVEKRMVLHVPEELAATFASLAGRHPDRLLVTPRAKPWTVVNAEETLLSMRARLGLPRYTLHGLRKTGVSVLKMGGMDNRQLRSLTGHGSDRNLEVYLDGIDNYAMAKGAQTELAKRYAKILTESKQGANERRFSGVTGRAAAKTGIVGESRRRNGGTKEHSPLPNPLPNAKHVGDPEEKPQ